MGKVEGGWIHPKRDGARTSGGGGQRLVAAAERPETIQAEDAAGAPEVVAGEVDVLPAERRDVCEQRVGYLLATAAQDIERAAEVDCVPERDGGGDEGEAAGAVLLQLGGRAAGRAGGSRRRAPG